MRELFVFTVQNEERESKMKAIRLILLLAAVLSFANSGLVFADLTPNQIVSGFNGLGTNGWAFSSSQTTERLFSSRVAANTPDVSAYAASTRGGGSAANYSFYTFCAYGSGPLVASGTARLNYNATTGATRNAGGEALSVGGALLYQRYAAGVLAGFDYASQPQNGQRSGDASTLSSTIRTLMTTTVQNANSLNWTSNKFLAFLLTINSDRSFWVADYDVNRRYDEIGDYAVFVMSINDSNGNGPCQDHLYVARADYGGGGGGVPEPATLLLWVFGSLGTLGVGYCRKRAK